ncbi:hypothetical protein ACFLY8_00690 [Halobacteriota archaeon]
MTSRYLPIELNIPKIDGNQNFTEREHPMILSKFSTVMALMEKKGNGNR